MCGLVAILNRAAGGWDREGAHKAICRGLETMLSRGTQGWKIAEREQLTVGHIRLPIINLSSDADQPMEVHGTLVTFVGEIFNYQEINPDATSDTQVLGERFNALNVRGFHDFDGFWAAVFWRDRMVSVVTDYLSQKPLYFHQRRMVVASDIQSIVAVVGPTDNLPHDPVYFSNVLKWGYDPTGRTPYKDIVQLPAGSVLRCYPNGVWAIHEYWDWDRIPIQLNLRQALVDATTNRLVGDRQVGLLLSGGLDSTILFKILTRVLGQQPQVFHAENDEQGFLEIALDGYPSTELVLPQVDLKEAVVAHQVPVDLGSMVPQLRLAKALREKGFYVAMSGDGADEVFGGYRRAWQYDSQGSDVFVELPYYHLPRLDRLMMAETIELRSPYLAPQVVKHGLSLPWNRRWTKESLKETFVDLVPIDILTRKKHPLKTKEVIEGGLTYRRQLAQIWQQEIGNGSPSSLLQS